MGGAVGAGVGGAVGGAVGAGVGGAVGAGVAGDGDGDGSPPPSLIGTKSPGRSFARRNSIFLWISILELNIVHPDVIINLKN